MEPLLTVKDAATVMHVSPTKVKRLIKSGDIVALKLGKDVRIEPADLQAYFDRHRTGGNGVGETGGSGCIPVEVV